MQKMSEHYIIPFFVGGTLVLTLFVFFLIAYLLVQKNKQNKFQLEKQKMIFDHENKILRTKIEEHENTMDQISKELHDNVKSLLGFAQMNMYLIADKAKDPAHKEMIVKTNTLIGNVMDELHHISHSLSSSLLQNIGIVELIRKELENFKLTKNIVYNFSIHGTPFSLQPEQELHICRIAQEAFQNIVKHAKATKIEADITYTNKALILSISDNGIGFDKNNVYAMKGLGFLNMFQRARFINARLDVQTEALVGCKIILTLDNASENAKYN